MTPSRSFPENLPITPVALRPFVTVACSVLASMGPVAASAQPQQADSYVARDISEMSLEELANVQVTSVTGRPASAQEAAASLFVITGDDIRRSSARSLPEALRLAPNLQVARTSANQWAVSARGFNNTIGNKLLVLIDGRTIYSPLFSGVFWDSHEVMLQDVDRIEVISGPGATLWGANAVNGVINVITRSASHTQGTLVLAEAGDDGHQVAARHGGRLGADGAWRAYALQISRDRTELEDGLPRRDEMRKKQVGLRVDWKQADRSATLQGDLYDGRGESRSNLGPDLYGGNLLGRWQQFDRDGSNWQLQAYLDVASRQDDLIFRDRTRTVDVQFNHVPVVGQQHKLIWGLGYRAADSRTRPTAVARFDPEQQSLRWSNIFVQNEWAATHKLYVTAGLKAERNIYTGTEWLPTVRASYRLSDTGMFWASASRAVRAPARLDREFFFPANPPFIIAGGPNFRSEVARVIELGYRGQHLPGVSYSATLFHTQYERLRAGRAAPTFIENRALGHVTGLETWGSVDLHARWRLSGGWVHLSKALSADALSPASSVPNLGNDPKNQWMLRSMATPVDGLELDATLRHVSALPQPAVAAYTVVDVRVGWRLSETFEASLSANNLGNREYTEFSPVEASRFGRSAVLKLVWRLP